MPFATTRTVSLNGALGHLIEVQADVSPGQVGTTLVGRPDASLNEARDRCRMAIINSLLEWPATKRITILLSPADLPKRGTHFDLAICVALLAADGQVPRESLRADGLHRGAHAGRRAPVCAGGAADGAGRRRARASPTCSCPSRWPARRRWCLT